MNKQQQTATKKKGPNSNDSVITRAGSVARLAFPRSSNQRVQDDNGKDVNLQHLQQLMSSYLSEGK